MRTLALLIVAAGSMFSQERDPTQFSMDKRGAPPQQPLWFTRGKDPKPPQECTVDAVSPSVREPSENPSTQDAKLPPGRLCPIKSPGGVRCDGAFLIWQAKMWGLEFAGKSMIPSNVGTPAVSLKEKVFAPDFAWRPGFKIDVGYDFDFDGWDLDSRWTFYRGEDTSLKKSFQLQTAPPGMGVVPLWFYPFYSVSSPSAIRFNDGSMSWRHCFNSIDLEIGRDSALSDRLEMRVFGGLKGAWIRQYYHVNYQNGSTIAATVPGTPGTVTYALIKSSSAFENEIWGAGPRIGVTSRWKIRWGVSLIADTSFSLLFSKVETHRDQNDLNLNTASQTQAPFHMHMKTNSHQLKPVAEAKMGLDWKTCIYKRSIIGFAIAYEIQYWWAQNELRRNYSHAAPGDMFPTRGDLQMHGLTAEVGYSY